VKSGLEHGLDTSGHRGEQTALEQDREQQILDWIKQNAEGSMPVTRKETKDLCASQVNSISSSSSNHSRLPKFLRSSLRGRNHSSKKFPQEEQRFQLPRVFIERTVQNLNEYEYEYENENEKEYVQGCTAELVFDLDEVGISD
jgi:hypothetical protein